MISPLIGLAGLIYTLNYVFTHRDGGFHGFYDPPSLLLLGVAPPCVMLLSHSLKDLFFGLGLLARSIFGGDRTREQEVIKILTIASQAVRTEGIGALMSVRNAVRYDLLRDGISLILNDFSTDEIQHNLQARIDAKQSQMQLAADLFENLSKVCPAVGMMGTLLGLAKMLANMKDPSTIGAGMAMAVIGTLYGLMLGTVVYQPFGERITLEAERVYELDRMVLDGVLMLKGKKSSAHLKDIVSTYSRGQPAPSRPARRGVG